MIFAVIYYSVLSGVITYFWGLLSSKMTTTPNNKFDDIGCLNYFYDHIVGRDNEQTYRTVAVCFAMIGNEIFFASNVMF